MRAPENMTQIVGGRRYSIATASLLAGNDWWDGHNYERGGTNQFLYRTARGAYFFVYLSQWQGSCDHIEPCSIEEAKAFWEVCHARGEASEWEVAFPNEQVEEA